MKFIQYFRLAIAITLATIAVVFLFGEMVHFDLMAFMLIKLIGFAVLLLSLQVSPLRLNLTKKQETLRDKIISLITLIFLVLLIIGFVLSL